MSLLYRTALCGALLALAAPTFGQDVEAVPPTAPALQTADLPPLLDRELFFGDPEISGAQLSPDGQYLTFRKPLDGVPNVWVKGLDEPFDAARPLTADARPVPGYFWSEDGRYVLYVQDKGGDENFHVYAVNPADAPDAETNVPPARNLTPMDGVRAMIYATPKSTPGEILIGLNDRDAAWHDVYRLDLETGERTLLIENTERVAGWVADLEGNVRLATRTAQDGSTEILRVNDDGSLEAEPVYTCSVYESCYPMRFHPDGRRAYMVTNKGERDLTELVLFDPETGEETFVERDPEGQVDFGGASFSEVTDEIVLTYYTGDRVRIYPKNDEIAADLDYLRSNLPDGDIYPGSRTSDDRKMLVTVTRDVDPGSVYLFDRETRALEMLYESRPELPSEHLAEMRAIRYTARDGMEIPAYLVLPKGVEPENLPTIIYPHGGPWSRVSYGYSSIPQFLANRGYAVLAPNFRGSTGYGKEFLNAGNKTWGTGAMQHDITDGVQYLIDEGIADAERVGIMGGSYGGYAALAGVTFTPDLYAAAVDIVGPSNLITLLESIPPYWESIRTVFHERMGDPNTEEGRAQLEAQSPLNFADRITTPLIVIQGANDPRVKQREADQIVVALRDRDYPVQYLVAPDEGHGFRGEENRMAMYAAVEAFLAEHLGGRFQADMPEAIRQKLDAITVDPATVTITQPPSTSGMAAPTFDGTALTPMRASYNITFDTQGQQIELVDPTREVVAVEHDGQPAFAVIDRATMPPQMGGVAVVDSFVVAQADLAPIYRVMRQGPATIELTYTDDRIAGTMAQGGQSMPLDVALDAPVLAGGSVMEVALGALPLAVSYEATFESYNPSPMAQGVEAYVLRVTGTEEVTVPAGTFETYVVAFDKVDGDDDTTAYVRTSDGVLVKSVSILPAQMGGGTVTAELTAVE
jgi:dipeptidyl aminopeptidase/acylaminoacyl peptidase